MKPAQSHVTIRLHCIDFPRRDFDGKADGEGRPHRVAPLSRPEPSATTALAVHADSNNLHLESSSLLTGATDIQSGTSMPISGVGRSPSHWSCPRKHFNFVQQIRKAIKAFARMA